MKNCIFCDENNILNNSLLYVGKHWKVYLANNQDYIGRLIITTKKHTPSLDKCNNEQVLELFNIIKHYENILITRLNIKMINYTYLMNSFAKKDKSLWHVHIHIIPRTDKTIVINNRFYKDLEYGNHYIPNRIVSIPDEDRNYLIKLLK